MKFENTEVRAAWMVVVATLESMRKSGENPHFGNKYAPLEEVLPALKDEFAKQNFLISQEAKHENGLVMVQTTFHHPKGDAVTEWMGTPAKADPQGTVGATTYLRRVQLMMVCGLIAEEDDDGNRGSGKDDTLLKIQNAKSIDALREIFTKLSAGDKHKYNNDVKMRKEELNADTK